MLTIVATLSGLGCASTDGDAVSPLTRAEVEEVAGLRFPASTTQYRSTRDSDGTTYVSCRIAATDVEAFARDGRLDLVDGSRAITNASPLWDLNPDGELAGTRSTRDGVVREVEVVRRAGTDAADVRLVITASR